jgi:hypothetical protein
MKSFARAVAFAATLTVGQLAWADEAADLTNLATTVAREQEAYDRAQAELERQRRDYAQLAEVIRRLKASDLGPLESATLQTRLRDADEQARRLSSLDGQLQVSRTRLSAAREQFRETVAARIEALQFELSRRPATAATRSELDRLLRVMASLDAPLPEYRAVPLAEIVGAREQTPEQLYAAADELRDYEARLNRQLGEVQGRLRAAERQELLRSRMREMAANDSLFDEGFGARSRAVTRVPTSTPAAGEATGDLRGEAEGVNAPAFDDPGRDSLSAAGAGAPDSAGGGVGSPVADGDRVLVRSPAATQPGLRETQVLVDREASQGASGGGAAAQLRDRQRRLLDELARVRRAAAEVVEAAQALEERERR